MLKKLIAENLYKWEKNDFVPPTQISITPTNLCNLRCQSCWQRDELSYSNYYSRSVEISEQKLCSIIKEASELGVQCVELTGGGEPLARRNTTIQLIKEIKNKGMMGWMTSNGTLFSPDIIKLMVELGWDKLTLSLDGPDAKTNDFLRPPSGSFEKVINVLRLFNEYKKLFNKDTPQITFNVVISKYNIDKIAEIIYLASKYEVEGVTFEPIKILSNQCKELLVNFEKEFGVIIKELERAKIAASKNNIFTNIDGLMRIPELIKFSGKLLMGMLTTAVSKGESKLLDVPCIEPWFHIYLEADGNVRPCCVNPGLGENINHKLLRDIWFGEKFSSFRDAIVNKDYPSSCSQCNANLICFSQEIQSLLKDKLSEQSRSSSIASTVHLEVVQGTAEESHDGIPPLYFVQNQNEGSEKYIEKTPPPQLSEIFVASTINSITLENRYNEEIIKVPQRQIKMVITDTAPLHPPLWGGPKRIWNLYSNFSPNLFDITYVGVNFGSSRDLKYNFYKIRKNFKEILCAFPAHYYLWHVFEQLVFKDIALDLFVYLWMHTDWQFKYVLNVQDADIIICSHPWSSLCCHKNNGQFFIYDAHNCEYLLMHRILGNHLFKNLVLKRVKKIEGDACKKSNLILACSEKEKMDLINLYKMTPDKIIVIPNGANIIAEIEPARKTESRVKLDIELEAKVVVFIGTYYKPNIDAVRFIIDKIAPLLAEFRFLIIGTVSDFFKEQQLPNNIIFLCKVSDEELDCALSASDIAINPMFDGSGTNIKMLDYMSYGLPIITTECGARGIEFGNRRPVIISSQEEFIHNIKMLSKNRALYEQMSKDAKDLVLEKYDWHKISFHLENAILKSYNGLKCQKN